MFTPNLKPLISACKIILCVILTYLMVSIVLAPLTWSIHTSIEKPVMYAGINAASCDFTEQLNSVRENRVSRACRYWGLKDCDLERLKSIANDPDIIDYARYSGFLVDIVFIDMQSRMMKDLCINPSARTKNREIVFTPKKQNLAPGTAVILDYSLMDAVGVITETYVTNVVNKLRVKCNLMDSECEKKYGDFYEILLDTSVHSERIAEYDESIIEEYESLSPELQEARQVAYNVFYATNPATKWNNSLSSFVANSLANISLIATLESEKGYRERGSDSVYEAINRVGDTSLRIGETLRIAYTMAHAAIVITRITRETKDSTELFERLEEPYIDYCLNDMSCDKGLFTSCASYCRGDYDECMEECLSERKKNI